MYTRIRSAASGVRILSCRIFTDMNTKAIDGDHVQRQHAPIENTTVTVGSVPIGLSGSTIRSAPVVIIRVLQRKASIIMPKCRSVPNLVLLVSLKSFHVWWKKTSVINREMQWQQMTNAHSPRIAGRYISHVGLPDTKSPIPVHPSSQIHAFSTQAKPRPLQFRVSLSTTKKRQFPNTSRHAK